MRGRLLHRRDAGVSARQPHGAAARRVDRRDEPRVDGAGEDGHDDVERGRVGDAQAIDLPLGNPGLRERRVDLASAAVDDDERGPLRRGRDGLAERRDLGVGLD